MTMSIKEVDTPINLLKSLNLAVETAYPYNMTLATDKSGMQTD